jgi:hypothetical protein
MATALNYRTGTSRGALRTVVVEDVRQSVVLLPTGSLDVLMAKLLHGPTCAHERFWAPVLDLDHESSEIAIPVEQVIAQRPIAIATRVIKHKTKG